MIIAVVQQRWGIMDWLYVTLLKYPPRHMPRVWKRRVNSWRWWQASTEGWFVLCVWSDRVRRDSLSSCKSSPALLLKMEHTILCQFVSLTSLFFSHPFFFFFFYCLHSLTYLCLGCSWVPVSSISVPSSPIFLSKPRPHTHWLTDREIMIAVSWHKVAPAPTPMRW